MDDKISYQELVNYITLKNVPIPEEIIQQMFMDGCSHRPIVHEAQKSAPLTFEEIQFQVRGRFGWNTETK